MKTISRNSRKPQTPNQATPFAFAPLHSIKKKNFECHSIGSIFRRCECEFQNKNNVSPIDFSWFFSLDGQSENEMKFNFSYCNCGDAWKSISRFVKCSTHAVSRQFNDLSRFCLGDWAASNNRCFYSKHNGRFITRFERCFDSRRRKTLRRQHVKGVASTKSHSGNHRQQITKRTGIRMSETKQNEPKRNVSQLTNADNVDRAQVNRFRSVVVVVGSHKWTYRIC